MKATFLWSLAPWLAPLASAQTTIHVPGDVPTIQAGIDLAAPGDTVLVAPGTYPEALDFLGKAIVVESEGGASATTVDATGLASPVVRFQSGEGASSVLRGFTLTGGQVSTPEIGAGVRCVEPGGSFTSPLIAACVIRGNVADASAGGGVAGSPILEDCQITDNLARLAVGGGVFGTPIVRRCTVSRNVALDGGGIYLSGAGAIEDSFVVENTASGGAHGGGIAIAGSDVRVTRTVIARNVADGAGLPASGAGVFVNGTALNVRFERCSIVANLVLASGGNDVGGLLGPAIVVDSILGSNDGVETQGANVTYSDVAGGYPGRGNIAANPLFSDSVSGDYSLLPGSPCLDRGDPDSSLDPDCTRADMGAIYLPRAGIALRNGTGVNRPCFLSLTFPVLGGIWSSRILTAGHAGAMLTGIVGRQRPLDPGLVLPFGELLLDFSSPALLRLLQPAGAGHVQFDIPIPSDPALVGFISYFQGFITGGGIELCNALDVKLGF